MHHVTVGGPAGLVYSPDTIQANPGDIVTFTFMSQNHTATQSTFKEPCMKMAGGVDSGFMPNPNNTVSPPPTMKFQVMNTDPVWMFCAQKGHCGKGMVFSINPTADKSHAKYKEFALNQGGAPPMAPSSASVAVSYTSAPPASASSPPYNAPPAPASSSTSASAPYVTQGSGTLGSGGACECSCLCGVSAFPPGTGIGMIGGLPGSIPWNPKKRAIQF